MVLCLATVVSIYGKAARSIRKNSTAGESGGTCSVQRPSPLRERETRDPQPSLYPEAEIRHHGSRKPHSLRKITGRGQDVKGKPKNKLCTATIQSGRYAAE